LKNNGEMTEELFNGGRSPYTELDGTNQTGNYIAMNKLSKEIPELFVFLEREFT
jgi:hypothetical protein